MPGRVQIRDARPDEFAAASEAVRAAYAQYQPFFPPERWDTMLSRFGDVWSRAGNSELLVAVRDDAVLGAASFYPDGSLSKQGEWPERWAGILRLGVRPECRRSGVARALVDECARRCREGCIAVLGLHTANWMPEARIMYERLGFIRTPSFDFHPSPTTVGMGYRLEL